MAKGGGITVLDDFTPSQSVGTTPIGLMTLVRFEMKDETHVDLC